MSTFSKPEVCMQDQAHSKPVVQDNLYHMISRLLRHAQEQTLAEFRSQKPQG